MSKILSLAARFLSDMLPETLLAVNNVLAVRSVRADYFLLAFVAFSLVESALIAEA